MLPLQVERELQEKAQAQLILNAREAQQQQQQQAVVAAAAGNQMAQLVVTGQQQLIVSGTQAEQQAQAQQMGVKVTLQLISQLARNFATVKLIFKEFRIGCMIKGV